jgi:hypothetical protein
MPAVQKQTIFISHSSLNKKVTDELYRALTDRYHLVCWLDNFDLQTEAGSFSAQIVEALRSSKLLVQVDSPAARASAYVQRELEAARDLQIPVRRCSIDEQQPAWLRKLRIQWLAMTIQLRLARGFLFAALTLFLLLAIMLVLIFFLGTRVAPALAQGGLRNLPAAFRPNPTGTAIPTPSDPKLVAPFHFRPDTVILRDDFTDPAFENSNNTQNLTNNLIPVDKYIRISQQNGSLGIFSPLECLDGERVNDCQLMLESKILDANAIQYFGLRARNVAGTYLRDISVSLSVNEPNRSRAGFGWDFTDRAMAFFHSIPALPETNLYDYVTVDPGWHAYEILRDPQKAADYYYIDGQLVDVFNPVHAREWDQAPLQLIIYSTGNKLKDPTGQAEVDTQFEIDEVVIGGFNIR